MTSKPKAKKFRIRQGSGNAEGRKPAAPQEEQLFDGETDDGFGDTDFRQPNAKEGAKPTDAPQGQQAMGRITPKRVAVPAGPDPVAAEAELDAIRAEGLTGRQLRMARRVAQRHGLTVASDFDAVRQLRAQGIDPFSRSNMLELVAGGAGVPAKQDQTLPAEKPVAPPPANPAPKEYDEGTRAKEIMKIQRDIAKRRRRKVALLSVRLFFFVMLPTLIAAFYFYAVATPMFATKSEFVIQQADGGGGGGGGIGSLFQGSSIATQQDSISVQSYLLSREALRRLDEDLGFVEHFSQDNIDVLQRLDADDSFEAAYRLYKKMVLIGYDPTEGLIKMEVIAADPQASQAFSEALIAYAEEQVDQLTARLRDDQMEGAIASYSDAETRLAEAQNRVVVLQEQLGVVSADVELSARMSQIGAIETELRERRLRLEQLLSNSRPNRAQVNNAESIIAQLDAELTALRDGLTESAQGSTSLARVSAELGVAQIDLETRTALLQQSAQQLETARIEANRQVRYLSTSVPPTAPDEATYPRSFENTLLAFIIFCGIYLMISLTSAILREQVSG